MLEDAASAVKSTESKTAIYEHLQPRDPIELMMISQMILMHELSVMVHLRATEEYKNGFIKTPAYAATTCKISAAYIRLVEALDSYRGKQKTQHIRVEQVMVESGANAIVGNVSVERGGRRNE